MNSLYFIPFYFLHVDSLLHLGETQCGGRQMALEFVLELNPGSFTSQLCELAQVSSLFHASFS